MKEYCKFNHSVKAWFSLLFVICVSAATHAQPSKNYEQAITKSRKIIEDTMVKQKIPGLSVAVAVDGEIIWSEGFGFADLENHVRVTPATKFRIASVSKLITAAAMARLYEQGKLDLDAPIQRYVPDFPRKQPEITSRELVGHLSGIRHYKRDPDPAKDEFFNRKKWYKSVTESLKIFETDPLDFTPGARYGYSSYGYNLLSAVIENASGRDFLTYVQDAVLDPLNMSATGADDNQKIIPNRTRFYSLDASKNVINAPYINSSESWAGGGFLSTSEDLVRLGCAHLRGDFLKEKTLKEMFTSQKTLEGKETGTGLGWRIGKDREGRRYYYHPGENVGGRSYLLVYPKEKIVIAMLHNLTGASLASIMDISRLFIAEKQ